MVLQIVLIAIAFAVIGYLFGNILFGSILGKILGKNFRRFGSQNIGATNVSRVMGKPLGLLVAVLDCVKGYIAVIICWIIFRYSIYEWSVSSELYCLVYICGIFAVLGHCFPIIYIIRLFKTKFNFALSRHASGGKGVSTSGGVVFAISPWLGLVGLGLWIVIIFITRYVSLASMIAILSVAFLIYIPQLAFLYLFNNNALFQGVNWSPNIVSQVILMLIMLCNSFISIGRHAPNINRLIHRKEKRFF